MYCTTSKGFVCLLCMVYAGFGSLLVGSKPQCYQILLMGHCVGIIGQKGSNNCSDFWTFNAWVLSVQIPPFCSLAYTFLSVSTLQVCSIFVPLVQLILITICVQEVIGVHCQLWCRLLISVNELIPTVGATLQKQHVCLHIQEGPRNSAPLNSARTRIAPLWWPCHRSLVLYSFTFMPSSSLYINACAFASAMLRFASCYAATAVMTTNKRRGKLLPQHFWISLPFPFASLFLVSNSTRSTDLLWKPSVNILYPAQLLNQWHGCEASLSLCLKKDGSLPISTHSCVSCSAPMYAWCGFCSCGKKEPGGSCCSRASAILVWLEANCRPLKMANSH